MTFTRSRQNLKVAILSIVAALAVNSASCGESDGGGSALKTSNDPTTCNANTHTVDQCNAELDSVSCSLLNFCGLELSKINSRDGVILDNSVKGAIELFVINSQLHLNKLAHDNIYGFFLEFGEGHLSIEEVMERAVRKVEILKGMLSKSLQIRQDKKEYRGIRELKLEVMGGAWSRVIEKIKEDIKRLNEKGKERITIQELRKEYREEAINGFREEYGEKERIFDIRFSKIELDELQCRAENWGYNSSLARNKVANKSLKIIK